MPIWSLVNSFLNAVYGKSLRLGKEGDTFPCQMSHTPVILVQICHRLNLDAPDIKTLTSITSIPCAFPMRICFTSLKFRFQVIGVVRSMNFNNSLDETITGIGHNYVTFLWDGIVLFYYQVKRVDNDFSSVICVT